MPTPRNRPSVTDAADKKFMYTRKELQDMLWDIARLSDDLGGSGDSDDVEGWLKIFIKELTASSNGAVYRLTRREILKNLVGLKQMVKSSRSSTGKNVADLSPWDAMDNAITKFELAVKELKTSSGGQGRPGGRTDGDPFSQMRTDPEPWRSLDDGPKGRY